MSESTPMDFSHYGTPTKQWLDYLTVNPAAAEDGLSGNVIAQAGALRQSVNSLRDAATARLLDQSGMRERITISTTLAPSRHGREIPIRQYSPKARGETTSQKTLVYFHGGGFLFGSETSDDYLCAEISLQLGITVLSVIYSHTPEHTFPAAHDDAVDVVHYFHENTAQLGISPEHGLAVLGLSAGALLAAELVRHDMQLARTAPQHKRLVTGVVFSIPWLIHHDNFPVELFVSPDKCSRVQCRDAPVIPQPRFKLFSDLMAAPDATDTRMNPGLMPESELQGWPRTGFVIAGMDPLRDDGLMFATKLKSVG